MCGNLFQMSQREGFGFHFIIVYGGRAMGIDKADVLEGCSCLLHGLADSENESGKLTVKGLKKATKLKEKELYAALGWLAREGKVSMYEVDADIEVVLL